MVVDNIVKPIKGIHKIWDRNLSARLWTHIQKATKGRPLGLDELPCTTCRSLSHVSHDLKKVGIFSIWVLSMRAYQGLFITLLIPPQAPRSSSTLSPYCARTMSIPPPWTLSSDFSVWRWVCMVCSSTVTLTSGPPPSPVPTGSLVKNSLLPTPCGSVPHHFDPQILLPQRPWTSSPFPDYHTWASAPCARGEKDLGRELGKCAAHFRFLFLSWIMILLCCFLMLKKWAALLIFSGLQLFMVERNGFSRYAFLPEGSTS